mgnify:FL=1
MTDPLSSCARPPTVGPILPPEQAAAGDDSSALPEEVPRMQARVGKPAPDFETTAYHQGTFKTIRLSDYAGKWVLLCFYPGDFTFV